MGNLLNLRHKTTTVLMSALLLPLSSQATEEEKPFEFGANIALSTDLVIRGMSYTNEEPSIQGGFDINHESGLYVETWATHVKLLEDETVLPEDRGNALIGLYMGYGGDFSDDLSYDIQAAHFLFPGAASDLNYEMTEFTANLSYSIRDTDLDFYYNYSPNFFLKTGKAHNFDFYITHTLANDLSFGGHIGKQTVSDNEGVGFEDYIHYGLSLSYPIMDVDFTLDYSNTDLDNADEVNAGETVYFTISKSL